MVGFGSKVKRVASSRALSSFQGAAVRGMLSRNSGVELGRLGNAPNISKKFDCDGCFFGFVGKLELRTHD
jgi:hypothetical protein